ncbi:MAG: lipid-A-disaccharide synthase [Pseudomonadota bacterium]
MAGPRLFVIAGEPSGDRLGASLLDGLHTLAPGLTVEGLGGPLMEARGLRSRFDISELAVMGLVEVLPKIPRLLRRVRETAEAVIASRPDALITIDSPDFCLRVAARVRKSMPGLTVIHYVAPSVWAWRPERAQKMAAHVDHVLALLPFEPPLMEAAGMTCDFVGHPVVSDPPPDPQAEVELRAATGLHDRPFAVLLPGSRTGEIMRMGPVFREVAERISAIRPDLAWVVPTVAPQVDRVRALFADSPLSPVVLDPRPLGSNAAEAQKRAALGAARAALAASGTVSLELAAAGTPMVIGYKANWLTTRAVKRLAQIETATLVNILTKRMDVPEFLFEHCTADKLSVALAKVLDDPKSRRTQLIACTEALDMLGKGGDAPGLRAARSVLARL